MLGRKLAERLARDGKVGGAAISTLQLVDVVPAPVPADAAFPVAVAVGDLAAPGVAARLVAGRPDVIFQLAAVVSGEAEADLDKGYRVNVDALRALLDAVHTAGSGFRPRLVFSSSIAVFGAPL